MVIYTSSKNAEKLRKALGLPKSEPTPEGLRLAKEFEERLMAPSDDNRSLLERLRDHNKGEIS